MMITAALDLAAQGWAVFPCKWHIYGDAAKAPLTVNGHHDASRDPDIIRSWWQHWPPAMIGAPVPEPFLVIDVDPRNNPNGFAELEDLVGPIPQTLTVWSGRNDGGRHLYFRRPAGQLISTRLPKGIDLKVNGYCIVPPSLHPATGAPYWWEQRPAAPVPPGLRDLLRQPFTPAKVRRMFAKPSRPSVLVDWVARRTTNINDAVYWAAKKAARDGLLDAIEEDLVRAADQAARSAGTWTPSGERQTRRTISSARGWMQRNGVR
jgi:hypothetical protein